MNILIDVQNDSDLEIPSEADFIKWIRAALSLIDYAEDEAEIALRCVSTEESQQFNAQYRGKDKPTNVLSFPADIPDFIPSNLLGDLIICSQVVAQEADEQQKTPEAHWAHMVVHGTLHLLGYDHIEEQEAEEMESIETKILQKLGFNDPYHIE